MKIILLITVLHFGVVTASQNDCPRKLNRVEQGRKCRKACSTDADCRGRQKRCICDNVCGMSCHNPNAPCNELEGIQNGRIVGTNRYGESMTYQCDNGYQLQGEANRLCRSDRKWSGEAPSCREILCNIPQIQNAITNTSAATTKLGVNVLYVCDRGYEIRGLDTDRITVICQENKQLSQVPTCQLIECEVPRIQNAITNTSNANIRIETGVLYICDQGYAIQGLNTDRITVVCQENKQLSQVPSCQLAGCQSNPCQNGGTCVNRIGGFTCYCTEGYSDDICSTAATCEIPNPPLNGDINPIKFGRVPFNTIIQFDCNVGYRRIGQSSSRCQTDGSWTNPVPSCSEIRCTVPQRRGRANVFPNRRTVGFNETITYSCPSGYIMVGRPSNQLTTTCTSSSRFLPVVLPQCREQDCPRDYYYEEPLCIKLGKRTAFIQSSEICKKNGATLPIVRSSEMNDKLENFIDSQRFSYRPYWLGLKLEANIPRWETGEIFAREQYNNFNFAKNSFITRNKPCAISRTRRLSYWGRRPCSHSGPYYLCTKWSSSVRPLSIRFENSSMILYLPENGTLKEGTAIYFNHSNEDNKTYLFKSKISETDEGNTTFWFVGRDLNPDNALWRVRSDALLPQQITEEWERLNILQNNFQNADVAIEIIIVNPCNSNPCQNGGTCSITGQSYFCICLDHVIGTNCETILNPCYSSPCQNGGTCNVISSESYNCDCQSGYGGAKCQLETCSAPSLPDGVMISNPRDSGVYIRGEQLTIRCRGDGFLSIAGETIRCGYGNTWEPDLQLIRCV